MRSRLPSRSPTTVLIWASASLIGTSVGFRLSVENVASRTHAGAEIVIERRFRGPTESGNGGYTCGLVAAFVDGPAEVTLRRPASARPAARGRARRRRPSGFSTAATLVAEAKPATVDLEPPDPPSFEEAGGAALPEGDLDSPFPECFVCGPHRERRRRLRIFAGPLARAGWLPRRGFRPSRTRGPEFVWAALDCPGAYAVRLRRAAARSSSAGSRPGSTRCPRAGERCVVVALAARRRGPQGVRGHGAVRRGRPRCSESRGRPGSSRCPSEPRPGSDPGHARSGHGDRAESATIRPRAWLSFEAPWPCGPRPGSDPGHGSRRRLAPQPDRVQVVAQDLVDPLLELLGRVVLGVEVAAGERVEAARSRARGRASARPPAASTARRPGTTSSVISVRTRPGLIGKTGMPCGSSWRASVSPKRVTAALLELYAVEVEPGR